ncbi:50S ribosomal protein L13 [Thermofilum pendens]|uniref:Large ribosomal subunit protein uL13 n=1 Tax=Thermofilum pendens (strain DSM 2475 / Hrk 5) TaxID=368408 RepID=A1RWV8_THEPD|nr:50S ribosomal protein L13 [Thermofilum pendens]ABL77688.1 LSU ribosomal protein L13P [Thermofilum pendens Hrk 5]
MSGKEEAIVIDGTGHIAGRLASVVAKRLLKGDRVVVVNAEKIVITGKPKRVVEKYLKRWVEWKTYYNPELRGPKYPKTPDRLFKRMVRGMLPMEKTIGRDSLKRLTVYVGLPDEYRNAKLVKVEEALFKNELVPYITLGELYKSLTNREVVSNA